MNASFMYHNLGIREQECDREEYQEGKTILHIRTKKHICCPVCGSKHVICCGKTVREIRSVPIGSKPIVLRMSIQRIECKECGAVRNEEIKFTRGKRRYTRCFERLVHDLSRIGTISDVARFLRVSWDTVKDIQKEYPTFIPFAKARKRIETDFSQFVGQYMLNRNYAKQPAGLFARVVSKIASFPTLQYVNYLSGKPLGHIKYALD